MVRNRTKAVIFDMDGTIVDNMKVHIDTWLIFIKQHGINLDRASFLERMHGNLREIISRVFELDPDDPQVMELGQAKEQFYRDTYRPNVKEITGFTDTLNKLNARHLKCALATMGDAPNIDLVVDELQIRSYFHAIIGGHEVKKGKPDPEIFNRVLQKLDLRPKDCLVIEDSISGVQSAKNARIPVIGITTTHNSDTLLKAGCFHTIDDYLTFDPLIVY
ncbi:MAG: HAD family phosphatase [Flavobacteriaceae bacterium]|nr:HAD family phosphatase [Bacteroidia bacterium]NNK88712.1 HAD family phosphatase [Flavobacteriaceae bacterium]